MFELKHTAMLVVTLSVAVLGAAAPAVAQVTERVSISSGGVQGDGDSFDKAVSADGRYVAFASDATNLVAGDTNDASDIFVRDRQTGTTTRVSVSTAGVEGDDFSEDPSISPDGRYVTWQSAADNLVAGDTNDVQDVFLRDRTLNETTRVSLTDDEQEGDAGSFSPDISADGRYVAFEALATNLVPGDTNDERDVFVRDRTAGTTKRVSVSTAGVEGDGESEEPAISDDGQRIAFESDADTLVAGDSNERRDVFLRNVATNTTTLVSQSSGGAIGDDDSTDADLSGNGRFVAFESDAGNLVAGDTNGTDDAFVRDLTAATTERVSVSTAGAQAHGGLPTISADGRFVAFDSAASNLVSGDTNGSTDVFRRDRIANVTERVSVDSAGVEGDDDSNRPEISDNGLVVGYDSLATNLVPGDTNGFEDDFVRTLPASADPYAALVLRNEPAGYWRFAEPSGTTALDSSGHHNHGTYLNGPLLGQAGIVAGNTAASFDGVNDTVRVPDSASLDVGDTFTVEGWIKRASTAKAQTLFNKGGNGLQVTVMSAANGNQIWLRKANVTTIAQSTGGVPADGRFHHVVVVRNGPGNVVIYIDGVAGTVVTSATQAIADTASPLIFADAGSAVHVFDEFALYDQPLAAGEVAAHYAAGLPPT